MNTVRIAALAAGIAAVGAAGAIVTHGARTGAHVISSVARTHTVEVPHEECQDVAVAHQAPVKDPHRLLGTGLGAAIGGILGHQVGGGRGKDLATVAGAAAGGYAGNQVQGYEQRNDVRTEIEHQCHTVVERHPEPAGYDVVYEYAGERHHAHMDHDPGSTLPVVDGKVVISRASSAGHG